MASDTIRTLMVEDNPADARLLNEYLIDIYSGRLKLTQAETLGQAYNSLSNENFDVVFLDLGLRESQGLETLSSLLKEHPQTPVIILSGSDDRRVTELAVRLGAQDYLVKGEYSSDQLERTIRYSMDRYNTMEALREANETLEKAYESTLQGWLKALEMRSDETLEHTFRVCEISENLGQALLLDPNEMEALRKGALLHDIGKMGVPDSILMKPGKLTPKEWEVVKKHTIFAKEWLSGIDYLGQALDIPYFHHEKWDGSGYPEGLEGEQIPLGARIFAVADVWDALTNDRVYRAAWSHEKAREHVLQESGRHFDPHLVEIFISILSDEAKA